MSSQLGVTGAEQQFRQFMPEHRRRTDHIGILCDNEHFHVHRQRASRRSTLSPDNFEWTTPDKIRFPNDRYHARILQNIIGAHDRPHGAQTPVNEIQCDLPRLSRSSTFVEHARPHPFLHPSAGSTNGTIQNMVQYTGSFIKAV